MVTRSICEFIWDERWWFPTNYAGVHYGWIDLQNTEGSEIYIPETAHLHWAFLVGIGLVALRLLLIRFVWRPFGVKVGILSAGKTYTSSHGLTQEEYKRKKYGTEYTILSKKTDRTEEETEELISQKELAEREKKYYRACWELMYYTTMVAYGLVIVLSNNWLQCIENIWIGWPKQHVSGAIYFYYIVKCGYYWNDVILFTQDFGHWRVTKRTQLLLHHASTLALIYCSWMTNTVRFGVIIGLLHDISDSINRVAKLCAYAGRKTLANHLLVIYFGVFTMFRMIAFSVFFFYYVMIEFASLIDEPAVMFYIGLVMLVSLVLINMLNTNDIYHLVERETHIFRGLYEKINSRFHLYGESNTSKRR